MLAIVGGGCRGPKAPSIPPAASVTIEVGRAGASLVGAAASESTVFVALASTGPGSSTSNSGSATSGPATSGPATSSPATSGPGFSTRIEARRGPVITWTRELEGRGGTLALAADGSAVYAALGGTGTVAGGAVRGEPGAAVVAIDAASGSVKWRVALDAGGWVSVAATAALPDGGVLVGGTYTNGLRAGTHTVGAAGRTDGFVLAIRTSGDVAWIVRMGGVFADTIQGVAAQKSARGTRLAIAGTFQATADLQGAQLPIFDERSPLPDAFVAELDANGTRVWSQVFGGTLQDAVAGVTIDAAGKVVVAATSTGEIHVGGLDFITHGAGDGVVSWWNPDGSPHHATLVGGPDFDGLRAIVAAGRSVVVGGFYSGAVTLGERTQTAGGGDDAFLAAYDPAGRVVDTWIVGGPGREEIVSLSPIRGGFVAGVAYTAAAKLAGASVVAPADPMSGTAVIVRGAR
ncbi:MAG: hypothetical protein ACKV2T_08240 [Kofleriaceae bacterium]